MPRPVKEQKPTAPENFSPEVDETLKEETIESAFEETAESENEGRKKNESNARSASLTLNPYYREKIKKFTDTDLNMMKAFGLDIKALMGEGDYLGWYKDKPESERRRLIEARREKDKNIKVLYQLLNHRFTDPIDTNGFWEEEGIKYPKKCRFCIDRPFSRDEAFKISDLRVSPVKQSLERDESGRLLYNEQGKVRVVTDYYVNSDRHFDARRTSSSLISKDEKFEFKVGNKVVLLSDEECRRLRLTGTSSHREGDKLYIVGLLDTDPHQIVVSTKNMIHYRFWKKATDENGVAVLDGNGEPKEVPFNREVAIFTGKKNEAGESVKATVVLSDAQCNQLAEGKEIFVKYGEGEKDNCWLQYNVVSDFVNRIYKTYSQKVGEEVALEKANSKAVSNRHSESMSESRGIGAGKGMH